LTFEINKFSLNIKNIDKEYEWCLGLIYNKRPVIIIGFLYHLVSDSMYDYNNLIKYPDEVIFSFPKKFRLSINLIEFFSIIGLYWINREVL
jgi:hypothetical protein